MPKRRTAAPPNFRTVAPKARRSAPFPWAGLMALLGSLALSAWLLSGGVSPAELLQTWYLSRAAGLVALTLLWVSVMLGLMQGGKLLAGVTAPGSNVDVHAFAALLAVYAATFHAWILLWDRFVPFRPGEILVPFSASYEPVLVGIGSLALYAALGAVVTTYLRGLLGPKLWRFLHRISALGLGLALVHGYLLGTDTRLPAVQALYQVIGWSTALLLAYRIVGGVFQRARSAG